MKKLANLLIQGIKSQDEPNRLTIISWLALARETVSDESASVLQKAQRIYGMIDAKATLLSLGGWLGGTTKHLPLSLKIALPATLMAAPFIGAQGAGVAALGTAVGMPLLLIVFLGTAGITAVIEAFLEKPEARDYISVVLAMIARDEALRRARRLHEAMAVAPIQPCHHALPAEYQELRNALLTMDPFEFERHVMSFFQRAGMLAWVTKQSNDAGVDGFARHSEGLILVQCKRRAPTNFIGRPVVQQLKGVIEENGAWRGYIVTTSQFTRQAIESAAQSDKVFLIDMELLIQWHQKRFALDPQRDLEGFQPASFLDDLARTLPKSQAKELEELRYAHREGFLSDTGFEKAVEELLSSKEKGASEGI